LSISNQHSNIIVISVQYICVVADVVLINLWPSLFACFIFQQLLTCTIVWQIPDTVYVMYIWK